MNTQDLMKIAEEHLASYLRLATSHEGKSLEDDEDALMWHDKADAIADLMDDFKKAGAGLIRCKDCKHWYFDADTGKACEFTNLGQPEDGFCNWAERKEK